MFNEYLWHDSEAGRVNDAAQGTTWSSSDPFAM